MNTLNKLTLMAAVAFSPMSIFAADATVEKIEAKAVEFSSAKEAAFAIADLLYGTMAATKDVTDEASAKKFADVAKENAAKLEDYIDSMSKQEKPSDDDIKALATKVFAKEKEMKEVMKAAMMDPEKSKLVEAGMGEIMKVIMSKQEVMDSYFPQKEMSKYRRELQAAEEEKEAEKAE